MAPRRSPVIITADEAAVMSAPAAPTPASMLQERFGATAVSQAEPRPSPSVSIVRGALALLSTQPITWTASLLLAVFVPRYLGDEGLGAYAVATSIAGLAALAASLGIPDYLSRRVAGHPDRVMVDGGGALLLQVGLALLLAIVLAVTLPLLHFPIANITVLRIALAGAVAATAYNVLLALLRGQERHARYAWVNAAVTVLTAAVGIGLLAAGGDVAAYAAAGVATSAGVFLAGWWISRYRLPRAALDRRLWLELARGGMPFLGMKVVLLIYAQIDVVLIAMLSREAVLGWYAAAYRIISIPVFIPTLITTPLLPALVRAREDRAAFNHALQQSLTVVLILTVPIAAMIVALAPSVPDLLGWSPAFQNSVPLMMLLAPVEPLAAVDTVLVTGLYALNRERRWLKVAAAAAVFNPALNFVLIPICERTLSNGAIGAAIITVATETLVLAGTMMLLPAGVIDRETVGRGVRVLMAGTGMAVVAAALRPLSLPLAVAAGGAAFVCVGAALNVLRPADLLTLWRTAIQSLPRRSFLRGDP